MHTCLLIPHVNKCEVLILNLYYRSEWHSFHTVILKYPNLIQPFQNFVTYLIFETHWCGLLSLDWNKEFIRMTWWEWDCIPQTRSNVDWRNVFSRSSKLTVWDQLWQVPLGLASSTSCSCACKHVFNKWVDMKEFLSIKYNIHSVHVTCILLHRMICVIELPLGEMYISSISLFCPFEIGYKSAVSWKIHVCEGIKIIKIY